MHGLVFGGLGFCVFDKTGVDLNLLHAPVRHYRHKNRRTRNSADVAADMQSEIQAIDYQ